MRVTVLRTAFSSIIYEGQDFSCALTDGRGRLLALSREDAPVHVGPMNLQVPAAVEKFRGNLASGDVLLANDPYTSGTHLNDVLLMAPYFAEGRPLFISCIRAHWGDIGGMTPGSISGRSTEIFQEGVRIPILKLFDAGKPNEAAMDLLFANVRQPRDRRGDFMAQLAATRTAADRFDGIVKRFGVGSIGHGIDQILDRTEGRMRARIASLAAGEYRFEDYMDSDGNDPDPVRVRVSVTVAGSGMTVDFTGSSPQRQGPVNASLAVASTSVFVALKALLDPLGHINEGAFRPVRIVAPPGSVVNANYPAPMGGFTEVYRRVSGTVVGALSRSAPDKITGDIKGSANHVYIGFLGEGRQVHLLRISFRRHGRLVECRRLERRARMGHRRLQLDPVGRAGRARARLPRRPVGIACRLGRPGLHRGGLGLRRVIRVESDRALFSVLSDRNRIPPYGVLGGSAAKGNRFYLVRGDAVIEPSPVMGKVSGFPLNAGDRVVILTAGGGGYGDALARDPALVAGDVASGLVSEKDARERYGVVLRNGKVIEDETAELRKTLAMRRLRLVVCASTNVDASEVVQVFGVNPKTCDATGLSDGSLVEVSTGQGAPLRGRLRAKPNVPEGKLALGEESRGMLGTTEDAKVEIGALLAPSLT